MNSDESEIAEEVSLFSISIGADLFAIETAKVREVLEKPQMRRVPLCPGHIVGVMPYRGEILTTVSFRALLSRSEGASETHPTGCVIVLEDEQTCELWGLSVDAAHGVLIARTATLQPNPPALDPRHAGLCAGAYETPSGLIVLLDSNRLKPEQPATAGLVPPTLGWRPTTIRGDCPCAH